MPSSARLAAVLLACGFAAIKADSQTFSIDAHVVSAGSSVVSASPCFRLRATLAEPVAGYSSSPTYAVTAGFRAAAPSAGDDLFFNGFEVCP